jgi:uncharacterized protein YjdB
MKTGKQRAFACVAAIIVCGFVFSGCNDGSNSALKDIPVTGVTLSETEIDLGLEDLEILTVTVLPANATNKRVSWYSSRTDVATVADGVVTPRKKGTAIITVMADDGGGQFKASCTVTVSDIAADSVTLDRPTLELDVGVTELLTPTVLPDHANKSVRWESSDSSKATVSDGYVTGVAAGTATITVITKNNKTASCIVTVNAVPVTGVELDETFGLYLWDSKRLTLTVLPPNATNKNVTWESDNPDVATVSRNGTVVGLTVGTANIPVTTVDGAETDTCAVTVTLPTVPPIPVVPIQAGSFLMGSPDSESGRSSNEDQHMVTLTKGFSMSPYHITQAQYRAVMYTNPSRFNYERDVGLAEFAKDWPVDSVNWYEAVEFCNRQSKVENLTPAYTIEDRMPPTGYPIRSATVTWNDAANGYRLPTEAEWEYACRAGTTTPFNFKEYNWEFVDTAEDDWGDVYDIYNPLAPVAPVVWGSDYIWLDWANFNGYHTYKGRATDTDRRWYGQTLPWWFFTPRGEELGSDGKDHANKWGLYNMHGMLQEWCWDWYDDYKGISETDPKGPPDGNYRVLRGGSWEDTAMSVRSARRNDGTPETTSFGSPVIGFRVVRN